MPLRLINYTFFSVFDPSGRVFSLSMRIFEFLPEYLVHLIKYMVQFGNVFDPEAYPKDGKNKFR